MGTTNRVHENLIEHVRKYGGADDDVADFMAFFAANTNHVEKRIEGAFIFYEMVANLSEAIAADDQLGAMLLEKQIEQWESMHEAMMIPIPSREKAAADWQKHGKNAWGDRFKQASGELEKINARYGC